MILADTSVWVQHFRQAGHRLQRALEDGLIVMHPFIIGELACGSLKDRKSVLENLGALEAISVVADEHVLYMIDSCNLQGSGLGYIDMHLLAAARVANVALWTLDKTLHHAAIECAAAFGECP